MEHAFIPTVAGSGRNIAVAQHVGHAGNGGVKQYQRAGRVGDDGDFAAGVVLLHIQVGEPFGGQRAGNAVHVHRVDMLFHPFAVQRAVPPVPAGIVAAQGAFPGANQGSRAAGGVHQVQPGDLFRRPAAEPGGGQRRQQLGGFRLGVVGGAFLPVGDQALPEFAGKVVHVLGVQPIKLRAEVVQQPQYVGYGAGDCTDAQALRGQFHYGQVVDAFNDLPLR